MNEEERVDRIRIALEVIRVLTEAEIKRAASLGYIDTYAEAVREALSGAGLIPPGESAT